METKLEFRAWVYKIDEMLEVASIHFGLDCVVVYTNDGDDIEFDFDEVVLMPYTGFKDINKNKIWAGDIISFEFDGQAIYTEVKLVDGCFSIIVDDDYFPLFHYMHQNVKVWGNIFENTELIKNYDRRRTHEIHTQSLTPEPN